MQGSAPIRPRQGRLVVWLMSALGALALLLAALAALAVDGLARSGEEIVRAEQSISQLENVLAIEAAFNRYMLKEIDRRLRGDPDRIESREAGMLRGAIYAYRSTLAQEIAAGRDDADRAEERAGLVKANGLKTLFDDIETRAMLDRARPETEPGIERARYFSEAIIAERQADFRALLAEIAQGERMEAARAFERMAELRRTLLAQGAALAVVFLIAAAVFGVLFHRGLMRPIRQFTQAIEGAQDVPGRVPEDQIGEFSALARVFNRMVARIGGEQQRLQTEVDARTAELQAANEELTRIDRSRREFFANISHELRTPVTVLLGEAQVALRGSGGEREALDRIAAHGAVLRRRLNDLMQLARSDEGQLKLEMAPVDLAEIVRDAAGIAEAHAEVAEVELTTDIPGPLTVSGDAEALRQAVLALVDNAIKFAPSGSAVTVRLTARGFAVEDRGPGFGDLDPSTLFDRYAQAQDGRGRGGSGLGLAIVKWIADQHGARLDARNRDGGGAAVTMEFLA